MPRPRTPIGSAGRVHVVAVEYLDGGGRRRLKVVGDPVKGHPLWRARAQFRFDDGRLRQVERFGTSRAKAETALRQALTQIQAASGVDVRRETRLRDLGRRFLEAKAGRAPRTLEAYRHCVDKVIVPGIGDLSVAEATPDRLQRFLDGVSVRNGPGAAKTARAVLSGMMGLAARSDAIRSNPVRELAAIEAKAQGAVPIPLDELPALLELVRVDERLAQADIVDLVLFVAGTGVRISEACAVRWDQVDLVAGTVTIGEAKTSAGDRRIRVPAGVVAMLTARRVKGGPNDEGVVFPTPLGRRRDPRGAAAEWARFRQRHGVPPYTFHSFRKTVATALDQAGLTPRDIAEYLGHADPSLTMGVYMSKTVGGSRAADALDSVMTD